MQVSIQLNWAACLGRSLRHTGMVAAWFCALADQVGDHDFPEVSSAMLRQRGESVRW